MSSAEESSTSSSSPSAAAVAEDQPVIENEDELSQVYQIAYRFGAKEYRLYLSEPSIYGYLQELEDEDADEKEMKREREQANELFDLLPPEETIFLAKLSCLFRDLALTKYASVECVCLYGSGGKNGAIANDIIKRLSITDPVIAHLNLGRFQLYLDRIENVKVIPALFDAVHTLQVVVSRFNYCFNTKLITILSEYNGNNGGKLRRLILIAEDHEEQIELNKIVQHVMTLQRVVDKLLIVHRGKVVDIDRELKRRQDKLRDRKGLKRSMSI